MRAARSQLEARFISLCTSLALSDAKETFARLWSLYTEPTRHYHGMNHVAELLGEFDRVAAQCENPAAVEMAIWFHDCIYQATRDDNEERSADIARNALIAMGADEDFVRRVEQLVLATKHNGAPDQRDERILVDLDLAPLGRPPKEFDNNGDNIRLEFAHLDDETFARGRAAMLGRFL